MRANDKILIIDDDKDVHNLLGNVLNEFGDLYFAFNQGEALLQIETHTFKIVIIDYYLSEVDNGIKLFSILREKLNYNKDTKYFILTSSKDMNIEILSHEQGIDDFLTKPISPKLIQSIIKKHLNRNQLIINIGPFKLDIEKRFIEILDHDKKFIINNLTVKEFELAIKFFKAPEKIFSRDELFESIWGVESDSTSRVIDVHISSLRKKIKLFGNCIVTVPKLGYKFSVN